MLTLYVDHISWSCILDRDTDFQVQFMRRVQLKCICLYYSYIISSGTKFMQPGLSIYTLYTECGVTVNSLDSQANGLLA